MAKLGFDEIAWEAGKVEGREILIACARQRRMIPYSDFVQHLRSIQFEGPRDPRLRHFLGEISSAEAHLMRDVFDYVDF